MKILQIILLLLLIGCGSGHQANIKKLDEVYGKCDNPLRESTMSDAEKMICVDKQRAAGPDGEVGDPRTFGQIIEDIAGKRGIGTSGGAASNVNYALWQGALKTLETKSIKNADYLGGYIETDWLTSADNIERCLIKVRVLSAEFVSTGIKTNIICQDLNGENWVDQQTSYVEEEKQLTLKILENAQEFNLSNNQ
jgi:hypothetical protein